MGDFGFSSVANKLPQALTAVETAVEHVLEEAPRYLSRIANNTNGERLLRLAPGGSGTAAAVEAEALVAADLAAGGGAASAGEIAVGGGLALSVSAAAFGVLGAMGLTGFGAYAMTHIAPRDAARDQPTGGGGAPAPVHPANPEPTQSTAGSENAGELEVLEGEIRQLSTPSKFFDSDQQRVDQTIKSSPRSKDDFRPTASGTTGDGKPVASANGGSSASEAKAHQQAENDLLDAALQALPEAQGSRQAASKFLKTQFGVNLSEYSTTQLRGMAQQAPEWIAYLTTQPRVQAAATQPPPPRLLNTAAQVADAFTDASVQLGRDVASMEKMTSQNEFDAVVSRWSTEYQALRQASSRFDAGSPGYSQMQTAQAGYATAARSAIASAKTARDRLVVHEGVVEEPGSAPASTEARQSSSERAAPQGAAGNPAAGRSGASGASHAQPGSGTFINGVEIPREYAGGSVIGNISFSADHTRYAEVTPTGKIRTGVVPPGGGMSINGMEMRIDPRTGGISMGNATFTGNVNIGGARVSFSSAGSGGIDRSINQTFEKVTRLNVSASHGDIVFKISSDGKTHVRGEGSSSELDGDLNVARFDGTIEIPPGVEINASTSSGEISGEITQSGSFSSSSGDISLTLRSRLSVQLSTNSGDVDVRGMVSRNMGYFVPPDRMPADGLVNVSTSSGDIDVRYQPGR